MQLGIIGSGKIVRDFLTALPLPGLKLAAIATTRRSAATGQELADQYGISRVYDDYLEMLKDDQVDTVYVATPSSMHYQMCLDSLAAGKNVICEKPFVFTTEEALELKQLADQKGCLITEAITNRYLPAFKSLASDLQLLGPVHVVSLNYTQYSSRYDRFLAGDIAPAFNPRLGGGGALLDLNVYNIHLAISLFGAPLDVHYFPNLQKGVDTSGVLVLAYDDKQASLTAAKDSQAFAHNPSLIAGEKGAISFIGSPGDIRSYRLETADGQTAKNFDPDLHRMIPEFTEFIRIFDQKDKTAADQAFAHSLQVIAVLEAARDCMP
ncbi:Gfo/Idh/MocA family oxidoreductase [Lactobacillus delbrueckii subsp. lactis]|uniref:Gfo/Idh/MocA family protein n=1 Tax=Lactobacillus delbrueckii TaxID=1584 RepID=UPI0004AC34A7|nr:Gfo/Idh/MocA family oxidoreductase [Lactobacillus delbrueckii]MCD5506870.1 Gfo/Idh/MocA family oxidoreductase [Lactobacillus delbrueckii subsp. lactis]MCD5520021.1 Gfo/Idh/MocA family oxidoreductase [Lactobacillus delbrueckii subsp. lactis]MCD5523953.1 Gfo/Idh/MocA family oxidoreductase [Lactobacillus delbrueckii subsp. lactis]MCD5525854.1 Gfo/Idh/MocA family oxidoreductase [Lactobacillus delbrueckii subsp. lactis]MCT3482471.1 gfo/Idh/MocA family oxidoreductase [Lactobacillus delbrueckii su